MTQHMIPEALSAYLDGENTAEERRATEAHLEACSLCRQRLAELQQTVKLVRALESVPAPVELRRAVRVRLQHARSPLGRLWHTGWRPSWKVLAATTAVLLIGLFSMNLWQQVLPRRAAQEASELGRVAPQQKAAERATDSTRGLRSSPMISPSALTRQVIRMAELTVEVRDVDEGAKSLMRIAEMAGGFVASTTVVRQTPSYGTFVLRVPASQFAPVLERIERMGEVKERHVSGQDITEEFIDLQARIHNLERHERQLLTFMDRATKVADLLAIEQELARVRGEIEQSTGRLRFMSNRVELAAVEVTLRGKAQQGTSGFWDFPTTMANVQAAFGSTVRQILIGAERLLVLASALMPLALLALPSWILIRWLLHRRLRLGT